jgi:hypothetical protein
MEFCSFSFFEKKLEGKYNRNLRYIFLLFDLIVLPMEIFINIYINIPSVIILQTESRMKIIC